MKNRKRMITLAMAALSLQFMASCFTYKKEETTAPAPAVVTVPPTTTSQTTTTTTDDGTVRRSTTTNYLSAWRSLDSRGNAVLTARLSLRRAGNRRAVPRSC